MWLFSVCADKYGMSEWHDILGVGPGAPLAEIKAAYRKKAMAFHPDVCKAPDAAQQFMKVNEAYRALTDSTFKVPIRTGPPRKGRPLRRPVSNGTICDAPPPTRDIWGNPVRKEGEWVDMWRYERPAPIARYTPPPPPEPDIDLWSQSQSKTEMFTTAYWREYNRLKTSMAYEEPEKFWDKLNLWVTDYERDA
jgi:hypothetical protein